jgi:hypothetical protein
MYYASYLGGSRQLQTGQNDWIVILISKLLCLDRTHYNTVKNVCEVTIIKLKTHNTYEPDQMSDICPFMQKVQYKSFPMHISTCFKEMGSSFKLTSALCISLCRAPDGLPAAGVKAIYNDINRSNHKDAQTISRHQVSSRKRAWKQAHFNLFR